MFFLNLAFEFALLFEIRITLNLNCASTNVESGSPLGFYLYYLAVLPFEFFNLMLLELFWILILFLNFKMRERSYEKKTCLFDTQRWLG